MSRKNESDRSGPPDFVRRKKKRLPDLTDRQMLEVLLEEIVTNRQYIRNITRYVAALEPVLKMICERQAAQIIAQNNRAAQNDKVLDDTDLDQRLKRLTDLTTSLSGMVMRIVAARS